MIDKKKTALFIVLALAIFALIGCGGSSGSSGSHSKTITVGGSVYVGPVEGATVTVKGTGGETVAGPVTTAADGTYSVKVPKASLGSDLIVESVGGSYTDEVSSLLTTAGTLAAYVPQGELSGGASVNLGPASTIIANMVTAHGETFANAESLFAAAFGYTPDVSITPVNAPPAGSDVSESLAALRAMAFSRLTSDLGLDPAGQFDLIAAISEDLSDGQLDGMNGVSVVAIDALTDMPEDIQNMFSTALTAMAADDIINLTGLTADQIGTPPFAKVALTNTYRIEYVPGMMPPAQGRTNFQLHITQLIDNSPATGLSVSLMPKMHMSSMNHSSPSEPVVESGSPGIYNCTVYYLMASSMNNMSMGYWELKVMAGENATFYPEVGMAMGDFSARATLKGQADLIVGMSGSEKRTYYIFNDGITNTTGTFDFFIAAKESMMSFPAVSVGTTLHDESSTPWTVTTMDVQVSTDASNWVTATDNTGGHWSASGVPGLDNGTATEIYVMITINSEQKTTDGNAVGATNGYATFTASSM